jgi:hypothetical protein
LPGGPRTPFASAGRTAKHGPNPEDQPRRRRHPPRVRPWRGSGPQMEIPGAAVIISVWRASTWRRRRPKNRKAPTCLVAGALLDTGRLLAPSRDFSDRHLMCLPNVFGLGVEQIVGPSGSPGRHLARNLASTDSDQSSASRSATRPIGVGAEGGGPSVWAADRSRQPGHASDHRRRREGHVYRSDSLGVVPPRSPRQA